MAIRRVSSILFLSLMVVILIFSMYQYRISARQIERIDINALTATAPQQHPLDTVLMQQLAYLQRSSAFDTLLLQPSAAEFQRPPISVDQCPVTQSKFAEFAQYMSLYNLQQQWRPAQAPVDWQPKSDYQAHKILGKSNAPVTGINHYDAQAYCTAAAGRLPSADEWEAIAASNDDRIYPWGNTFNNMPWRFSNPLLNAGQSCAVYPTMATAEGVQAMGFGVSEWTNQSMIMGANGASKPASLHALRFIRRQIPQNFRSQFVGFRCVYPPTAAADKPTPWGETTTRFIPSKTVTLGVPDQAKLPPMLRGLRKADYAAIKDIFHPNQPATAFVISKYEITVSQYQSFMRDPLVAFGFYANTKEPANHDYTPARWSNQLSQLHAPVTGISWWDADAFARWAGGRLPTQEQWTAIFAANSTTIYPWGNIFDAALVVSRAPYSKALAVDDRRNDVNPYGVVAMAGNVSEWTSSIVVGRNDYFLVVKGGNYVVDGATGARIDYIAKAPAYHRSPSIGMRVIFNETP